jgi:hypothetical protein
MGLAETRLRALAVYFESEQKARANERSQNHQVLLGQMLSLIDGQPEYVDLTPVQEIRR